MRALCVSMLAVAAIASAQASPAFAVMAAKKKSYSEASITAAEQKHPGLVVSADRKSLSVNGSAARLVIRTGPEDDMMSFRTLGLRNPTLNVRVGTKFTIVFINTDGDMLHNFRLTTKRPPFDSKTGNVGTAGSADLPHKAGKTYAGQELTITAPKQKGTYSYVCTIPGHAAAGMYGTINVR